MAQKYYVVKNGRKTGIFQSKKEFQDAILHYPKFEAKSFKSLKEAENWLEGKKSSQKVPTHWYAIYSKDFADVFSERSAYKDKIKKIGNNNCICKKNFASEEEAKSWIDEQENLHGKKRENCPKKETIIYADGGYLTSEKIFSYGCVILHDDKEYYLFGAGKTDNPKKYEVPGCEILAVIKALHWIEKNNCQSCKIYTDCEYIENRLESNSDKMKEINSIYENIAKNMTIQIKIADKNEFHKRADKLSTKAQKNLLEKKYKKFDAEFCIVGKKRKKNIDLALSL